MPDILILKRFYVRAVVWAVFAFLLLTWACLFMLWEDARSFRYSVQAEIAYLNRHVQRPNITTFQFPESKGAPYFHLSHEGFRAAVPEDKKKGK